jgi:hypothetical protein
MLRINVVLPDDFILYPSEKIDNFKTKNQILYQFLSNVQEIILLTLSGSIDFKQTKKIQWSRFRQFNLKLDFFEKLKEWGQL